MFSKAEVQIILDGKNNFGPNDAVKGEVLVTAKKDFSLSVLEFMFSGEVAITMKRKLEHIDMATGRRTTSIITHTEKHVLFAESIDLGVGHNPVKMNKEDSRRFEFCTSFPESVECQKCHKSTRLPSSNFATEGVVDSLKCQVSVVYSLTATVEPDSKFGKATGAQILNFTQIGDDKSILKSDNALSYYSVVAWEGKIKKFIDLNYEEEGYGYQTFDAKNIECIPSPLDEAHNHSRSLRKIFNSSYKKENYSKLVGDVELQVEIIIKNRIIYDTEDVRDCFSFIFRTKIAELQPDYLLYSKKSSQLGLFSISSATIVLIRNYSIMADTQMGHFEQRKTIFHKKYGHELTFDIVDFTPNYQDPNVLEWNIPMKEILFPEKIMCLANKPSFYTGCGNLRIRHQLSITLTVSDLEEDPKPIEFIIDIKMM